MQKLKNSVPSQPRVRGSYIVAASFLRCPGVMARTCSVSDLTYQDNQPSHPKPLIEKQACRNLAVRIRSV